DAARQHAAVLLFLGADVCAAHHTPHVLAFKHPHLAHTAAALAAAHGNALLAQRHHAFKHGALVRAGVVLAGVLDANGEFLHAARLLSGALVYLGAVRDGLNDRSASRYCPIPFSRQLDTISVFI